MLKQVAGQLGLAHWLEHLSHYCVIVRLHLDSVLCSLSTKSKIYISLNHCNYVLNGVNEALPGVLGNRGTRPFISRQ